MKPSARRSSILKIPKAREPFSDIDFNPSTADDDGTTKEITKGRRVSFCRKKNIAEFASDNYTTQLTFKHDTSLVNKMESSDSQASIFNHIKSSLQEIKNDFPDHSMGNFNLNKSIREIAQIGDNFQTEISSDVEPTAALINYKICDATAGNGSIAEHITFNDDEIHKQLELLRQESPLLTTLKSTCNLHKGLPIDNVESITQQLSDIKDHPSLKYDGDMSITDAIPVPVQVVEPKIVPKLADFKTKKILNLDLNVDNKSLEILCAEKENIITSEILALAKLKPKISIDKLSTSGISLHSEIMQMNNTKSFSTCNDKLFSITEIFNTTRNSSNPNASKINQSTPKSSNPGQEMSFTQVLQPAITMRSEKCGNQMSMTEIVPELLLEDNVGSSMETPSVSDKNSNCNMSITSIIPSLSSKQNANSFYLVDSEMSMTQAVTGRCKTDDNRNLNFNSMIMQYNENDGCKLKTQSAANKIQPIIFNSTMNKSAYDMSMTQAISSVAKESEKDEMQFECIDMSTRQAITSRRKTMNIQDTLCDPLALQFVEEDVSASVQHCQPSNTLHNNPDVSQLWIGKRSDLTTGDFETVKTSMTHGNSSRYKNITSNIAFNRTLNSSNVTAAAGVKDIEITDIDIMEQSAINNISQNNDYLNTNEHSHNHPKKPKYGYQSDDAIKESTDKKLVAHLNIQRNTIFVDDDVDKRKVQNTAYNKHSTSSHNKASEGVTRQCCTFDNTESTEPNLINFDESNHQMSITEAVPQIPTTTTIVAPLPTKGHSNCDMPMSCVNRSVSTEGYSIISRSAKEEMSLTEAVSGRVCGNTITNLMHKSRCDNDECELQGQNEATKSRTKILYSTMNKSSHDMSMTQALSSVVNVSEKDEMQFECVEMSMTQANFSRRTTLNFGDTLCDPIAIQFEKENKNVSIYDSQPTNRLHNSPDMLQVCNDERSNSSVTGNFETVDISMRGGDSSRHNTLNTIENIYKKNNHSYDYYKNASNLDSRNVSQVYNANKNCTDSFLIKAVIPTLQKNFNTTHNIEFDGTEISTTKEIVGKSDGYEETSAKRTLANISDSKNRSNISIVALKQHLDSTNVIATAGVDDIKVTNMDVMEQFANNTTSQNNCYLSTSELSHNHPKKAKYGNERDDAIKELANEKHNYDNDESKLEHENEATKTQAKIFYSTMNKSLHDMSMTQALSSVANVSEKNEIEVECVEMSMTQGNSSRYKTLNIDQSFENKSKNKNDANSHAADALFISKNESQLHTENKSDLVDDICSNFMSTTAVVPTSQEMCNTNCVDEPGNTEISSKKTIMRSHTYEKTLVKSMLDTNSDINNKNNRYAIAFKRNLDLTPNFKPVDLTNRDLKEQTASNISQKNYYLNIYDLSHSHPKKSKYGGISDDTVQELPDEKHMTHLSKQERKLQNISSPSVQSTSHEVKLSNMANNEILCEQTIANNKASEEVTGPCGIFNNMKLGENILANSEKSESQISMADVEAQILPKTGHAEIGTEVPLVSKGNSQYNMPISITGPSVTMNRNPIISCSVNRQVSVTEAIPSEGQSNTSMNRMRESHYENDDCELENQSGVKEIQVKIACTTMNKSTHDESTIHKLVTAMNVSEKHEGEVKSVDLPVTLNSCNFGESLCDPIAHQFLKEGEHSVHEVQPRYTTDISQALNKKKSDLFTTANSESIKMPMRRGHSSGHNTLNVGHSVEIKDRNTNPKIQKKYKDDCTADTVYQESRNKSQSGPLVTDNCTAVIPTLQKHVNANRNIENDVFKKYSARETVTGPDRYEEKSVKSILVANADKYNRNDTYTIAFKQNSDLTHVIAIANVDATSTEVIEQPVSDNISQKNVYLNANIQLHGHASEPTFDDKSDNSLKGLLDEKQTPHRNKHKSAMLLDNDNKESKLQNSSPPSVRSTLPEAKLFNMANNEMYCEQTITNNKAREKVTTPCGTSVNTKSGENILGNTEKSESQIYTADVEAQILQNTSHANITTEAPLVSKGNLQYNTPISSIGPSVSTNSNPIISRSVNQEISVTEAVPNKGQCNTSMNQTHKSSYENDERELGNQSGAKEIQTKVAYITMNKSTHDKLTTHKSVTEVESVEMPVTLNSCDFGESLRDPVARPFEKENKNINILDRHANLSSNIKPNCFELKHKNEFLNSTNNAASIIAESNLNEQAYSPPKKPKCGNKPDTRMHKYVSQCQDSGAVENVWKDVIGLPCTLEQSTNTLWRILLMKSRLNLTVVLNPLNKHPCMTDAVTEIKVTSVLNEHLRSSWEKSSGVDKFLVNTALLQLNSEKLMKLYPHLNQLPHLVKHCCDVTDHLLQLSRELKMCYLLYGIQITDDYRLSFETLNTRVGATWKIDLALEPDNHPYPSVSDNVKAKLASGNVEIADSELLVVTSKAKCFHRNGWSLIPRVCDSLWNYCFREKHRQKL